ncbi:hypothetical protein [Bacillus massiliglaciei]|uniref:hypothetical protein n=1 Tax=Bacillus massiliglaciei TaxID=1816693 RepID=UPI000DA62A05|nr:hypothetical protein [Bacillus massiliglaciei]
MKNIVKIFCGNAAVLLLILLLAGCINDQHKESRTASTDNSVLPADPENAESYNDTEQEATQSEQPATTETVDPENNRTQNETSRGASEDEPNTDNHHSTTQNEPQIKTDTDEKEKEKAISFVQAYLREKGELIEDENHFVQYDGEINGYIIVRYSTLADGHSSTNGRYAADLDSGEVTDITADPDFLNQ